MSLIFPDEEAIDLLSSNAIDVSSLRELVSSDIQQTDVLTYARQLQNFNVEKKTLDNAILNKMLSSNVEITGIWNFGQIKNSSVEIDTTKIINNFSNNKDVVLTKLAFEKLILSKIDALSNLLYGKNAHHVPTHVGEMITTVSNDNQFYGNFGIIGNKRMIAGQGSVDANTIESKYGKIKRNEYSLAINATGGQESIGLTTNNIINHTHRFNGKPINIDFSWSYHGDKASNVIATAIIDNYDDGHEGDLGSGSITADYNKAILGALNGFIKITGETDIATNKVFQGDSALKKLKHICNPATGTTLDVGVPHNNIPPVFFARIYKRNQ